MRPASSLFCALLFIRAKLYVLLLQLRLHCSNAIDQKSRVARHLMSLCIAMVK